MSENKSSSASAKPVAEYKPHLYHFRVVCADPDCGKTLEDSHLMLLGNLKCIYCRGSIFHLLPEEPICGEEQLKEAIRQLQKEIERIQNIADEVAGRKSAAALPETES